MNDRRLSLRESGVRLRYFRGAKGDDDFVFTAAEKRDTLLRRKDAR